MLPSSQDMCESCSADDMKACSSHLRDARTALGHVALRLLGALLVATRQLRTKSNHFAMDSALVGWTVHSRSATGHASCSRQRQLCSMTQCEKMYSRVRIWPTWKALFICDITGTTSTCKAEGEAWIRFTTCTAFQHLLLTVKCICALQGAHAPGSPGRHAPRGSRSHGCGLLHPRGRWARRRCGCPSCCG